MRRVSWMLLGAGLLFVAGHARADEELRNDGFESGDTVQFQQGFVVGEIGASRLTATISCPCSLQHVDLLFGGVATTQPVTLRIWQDDGTSNAPGAPIFSADYSLVGSNTQMQQFDLSADGIVVPQSFRVGLEVQHSGLPSIAADTDLTITEERNFILADGFGWVRSSFFFLAGDWIIRATVRSLAFFADGFESGTTGAWSLAVP